MTLRHLLLRPAIGLVLLASALTPRALAADPARADAPTAEPAEEPVAAPYLFLIVNDKVPFDALTVSQVRDIYLGKTTLWPKGGPVRVFGRPLDTPVGSLFLKQVLDITSARYRAHWQQLQLAGRGISPLQVASLAEAAARVGGTPGALVFALSTETLPLSLANVKMMPIVPDPEKQ